MPRMLDGEVAFTVLGREYPLNTGDVLILAPGVEHEARSTTGGTFLLTVLFLGTEQAGVAAGGS